VTQALAPSTTHSSPSRTAFVCSAAASEPLQHLQVDLVGLTAAAVLLGVRQPQQAGLAEDAEELARELAARLVLGRPRRHLAVHEVAGELQERLGLGAGQCADDGRHAGAFRSGLSWVS
jgi:hypothetical protein